jgi:hypothetical protein
MLAGDREVKLVLVEPGGQQDRGEALILNRKPHEVVVPRHAPVAGPGLALDLNDRPRLQEVGGRILCLLAGARILLGEGGEAEAQGAGEDASQDLAVHRTPSGARVRIDDMPAESNELAGVASRGNRDETRVPRPLESGLRTTVLFVP